MVKGSSCTVQQIEMRWLKQAKQGQLKLNLWRKRRRYLVRDGIIQESFGG
jgi:hypothetical protein